MLDKDDISVMDSHFSGLRGQPIFDRWNRIKNYLEAQPQADNSAMDAIALIDRYRSVPLSSNSVIDLKYWLYDQVGLLHQ
jgi:hypothetical protein